MGYPFYFRDFGEKLQKNGYAVVPLLPGEKRPSIDDWSTKETTLAQVIKWAGNGKAQNGVGSLCKITPVVDLDIRDRKIVEKLVAWCDENIGRAPRRIGEKPKAALFFRCDLPFRKLFSKKYVCPEGKEHRVEILGDGQQCVVFAIHPDTKKPYRFAGKSLIDTPRDELPVLTEEKAKELIAYFENSVPKNWKVVEEGVSSSEVVSDEFEQAIELTKEPLDLSPERVRATLKKIPADISYHEWCNIVGKALYHQFSGDADGLELWDSWSSRGHSYEDGLCERKWSTFDTHARPGRKTVTFASVIQLAKKYQKKKDNLDNWLTRLRYVAQGELVCDLSKPPHRCLLKLSEFRNLTSNITHEVPDPIKSDPERVKIVPIHSSWMRHPERQHVHGTQYTPGAGRITTDEHGLLWVNEFHMPEAQAVYDPDKLIVFFEHMEYLIPDEIERLWFLGWLAFNLQRPETRCKVTPLHISIEHGTGRGWVVELIGKLVGQWNCTKTKMATLSGEGNSGAYNDYLDKSLVCCIEEVREGGKRFGISDKTRDVLSDLYLEVNKKYGTKETKRIYTNFFFMSNHPDALVLTEEDRRINVLSGPEFVQPPSYYDQLYQWLETDGPDHLRAYLLQQDLSGFNWQRSLKTPGRTLMIESNRTPTEEAFMELLEDPPVPVMTQQQVVKAIADLGELDAFDVDEKQVSKLLQHHARHLGQIKVDKKKPRPWQLVKGKTFTNVEIRKFLTEIGL